MKMFNMLITSSELVNLTSFVGSDKDVSDTKRLSGKLIKWMWIAWVLYAAIYVMLGIFILDISYGFIPSWLYLPLLFFALLNCFIFSIIENLNIFNTSYTYELKIQSKILAELIKYLDKSDKRVVNDYQEGFNKYHFNLFNVGTEFIGFFVLFCTAVLSNTPIEFKVVVILIIGILVFAILVIGKYWVHIARKCYKTIVSGSELSGKRLTQRVLIPAVFNLTSSFIFPVALILLSKLSMNTLIVQVALLGGMISFGWSLISNIEKFNIAKEKLTFILSRMNQIQERYVINKYGFAKLCARTKPSSEILKLSKKNKSLVLDNFIPMSYSNSEQSEPSHCYSYEFAPGLYQLNGLNGVGKTTLLKSLTLPEGVLVELSSGGVAFCGKPFFNCGESLIEHREEFRYIGADSIQSDVNRLMIDLFGEFPLIREFIQKSTVSANEVQSEGEKGVISIATVYQDCMNGINEGLIFIDEILSRIYGKSDFPLRQEIVRMLSDMLKIDDNLIIVIVDHVTHVDSAVQLKLEKKQITISQ